MSASWLTLDGHPTRIIAHRGASGVHPEHTRAAFERALIQGADVLEPDLVISRDGVLVVRHDRGLRRSTDVASHAKFAARMRDGDWRIDDFDRSELDVLHAIQPFAQRDRSQDGVHPLLDFAQLLAFARDEAVARGRPVPLYPELKHPDAFAQAGHDIAATFIAAVRGHDGARVPLLVQCFEVAALRRVKEVTALPAFLLLDADADVPASLRAHGAWLDGLGIAKSLLADADGRTKDLVARAHEQGLQVHAWTYRDDQLPAGIARVEDELELAFALGVDAVFCDFPATALVCRERWAAD